MKPKKTWKIRKGLDLPITGAPEPQAVEKAREGTKVAILGSDYVGLRPTLLVKEGERVRKGQPLLEDKKNPGVLYTAPSAGIVESINRGDKRVFVSLVIERGEGGSEKFPILPEPWDSNPDKLRETLIKSGTWTAFRTRPFSKAPGVDDTADAIFVNVHDTNPLAPDPAVVLKGSERLLEKGIRALLALTSGSVYVVTGPDFELQGPDHERVEWHKFQGPHPAGLAGTHIHSIQPVHAHRTVWSIGYQEVLAMARLLESGELSTERVVSLAGPAVTRPRLVRTHLGAQLSALVRSEAADGPLRIISGSVLQGHLADGPTDYLGRHHNQVSVLSDTPERKLLGWHMPGFDSFSNKPVFVSSMIPGKKFNMVPDSNGSPRSMVPIGAYEKVMPLDILPTHLLRALASKDYESATSLGVLELDEEDLALCTFVCPGKTDWGVLLRDALTTIEKEG